MSSILNLQRLETEQTTDAAAVSISSCDSSSCNKS
ncbi:MAG TPA: class III lanthipeptide [Kribbellaceae bacterium]